IGKIKIILVLAMPAVVENFFQTIIGFVDTYFVSKIGLAEVSAVGVSNAVLAIYFALFMAIGVAANVRISNFLGAKQPEKARHIAQQSIILAILFGLATGIITVFFAGSLLKFMGIEANVLEAGKIYFKIVAIPSIFMSLMFVLSAILRGAGDTRAPMKVSVVINILNAGLDYIFIFGLWIITEMGVAGAALATVVARVIGSLALLYYIKRSTLLSFRSDFWKPDRQHLWELVTLGGTSCGRKINYETWSSCLLWICGCSWDQCVCSTPNCWKRGSFLLYDRIWICHRCNHSCWATNWCW